MCPYMSLHSRLANVHIDSSHFTVLIIVFRFFFFSLSVFLSFRIPKCKKLPPASIPRSANNNNNNNNYNNNTMARKNKNNKKRQ